MKTKRVFFPAIMLAVLASIVWGGTPNTPKAVRTVPGGHHLVVHNHDGKNATLIFGVNSNATSCIDPDLGETELPPVPPSSVLDFRFLNNPGQTCLGQGLIVDFHHFSSTEQSDTFKISIQAGDNGFPLVFAWDSLATEYS